MRPKADCQAYKKWKEERSKKSQKTRKEKKRKRKEPTVGCIDEDEIEETAPKPVLKFNYRKCKELKKKRKKKKQTGRLIRKIYKRISFSELVLGCIKPTIEERRYLLYPRHVNCLDLDVGLINAELETGTPCRGYTFDPRKRIPCIKGARRRRRRKRLKESDSEDSECDSICSFDSNVCLTDVKLTTKDKEEIKKYQREAREAATKEEN